MTLEELRTELRTILSLEQQPAPDWRAVEERCLHTIGRLNMEPEPSYPHDVVYHYLEDAEVRQSHPASAQRQRERLRQWLDAPPEADTRSNDTFGRKARVGCYLALYWPFALMAVGFAMIFHGDCGTGGDDIQRCLAAKRNIRWIGLVTAAAIFGLLVLLARKGLKRQSR